MKKSVLLLGLALSSSILVAEDVTLDKVTVESSTISDMAVDAKTEVSTVNVINEKTIEEIDPKNINDLLQTIPGITTESRNNIVKIHIRGVGQQEFMWEDTGVAIVIDGVPVLQDRGTVRLNMNEIESVKVIKGGASYLYGDTALAGAVIITTKKNKDKKGGEISAEAGSYGYRNYKGKAYYGTNKYSLNAMTSYKEEDGYWYHSANDEKTFNGLFTYYIDDMSDISLGIDYIDGFEESGSRSNVRGVTEAITNPTAEGDYAWSADYDIELQKYFVKYSKDFDNGGNLLLNTYYYKDTTSNLSSPIDTSGEVNATTGELVYDGTLDDYARQIDEDVKQYGFKAEYRGDINDLAYLLGTDIGQRNSESYSDTLLTGISDRDRLYYAGESSYDNDKEDRYAFYGEAKYKVNPKFTVVFNTRYDHDKYTSESDDHDYNGTDWVDSSTYDSVSFNNMSYRVGTTYNMNDDTTLYANISTGFRNPKVRQYSDNPSIDPETTINYEIGSRGKIFNDISYEASLYITDTKDIIGKVNGTYYWADDPYYDNVGDARTKGLEITLKSNRNKKVSFSLAYTYLDSYYTAHNPFAVDYAPLYTTYGDQYYDIVGNQLPRVPHHKLDLIVNYKFMPKWNLMSELYAQSHYYADETNFVTMPGYAKVNMRIDYNHNKNLNFYLKVDNILDKQYYRSVYLYSDKNYNGVLDAEDASITVDPGRVWYAGFKYKF